MQKTRAAAAAAAGVCGIAVPKLYFIRRSVLDEPLSDGFERLYLAASERGSDGVVFILVPASPSPELRFGEQTVSCNAYAWASCKHGLG